MFQDVLWSPGSWMGLVLTAIGIGAVIWFIIRRQKHRRWLPILEVLDLNLTSLPKLRWRMPPIWPFMCFLVAAGALALYSFEPAELISKKENLDLRYTHVFFDLSPSMSARWTLDDYAKSAENFMNGIDQKTRLSFNLSSKPEIFSGQQRKQVGALIRASGFHRAGLKIGTSVEAILNKAPEIEHLVVVSDRDRASWEDFNWSYLENKVQISWAALDKEKSNPEANVFIDDIKSRSSSSTDSPYSWIVLIRRSGPAREMQGKLQMFAGDKLLGEQLWRIDREMNSIELDMSLARLDPSFDANTSDLTWKLLLEQPDSLEMDNTFQAYFDMQSVKALIIAQPPGEMFLEDSMFHLKTSLEVLGFEAKRIDRENDALEASLLVSEARSGYPASFFCPKPGKDKQIWLLPSQELRDFEQLCFCFARLMEAPRKLDSPPAYCKDLETREQYVGVLQSLGASQIGGNVNSPVGALGMQFINKNLNLRVIAFTVALQPSPQISYGQLPLLLKSLLAIAPLNGKAEDKSDQDSTKARRWRRYEDISKHYQDSKLATVNIPFLESSLQQIPIDRLPPLYQRGDQGALRAKAAANREKDARPWIEICLTLVAFAMWLELLGGMLRKMFKQKLSRWFGVLILGLALGASADLKAQVRLNLLGYPEAIDLQQVKREVSGRTSIEVSEASLLAPQFSNAVLAEPWIWVARPELLDSLSTKEQADLLGWLQRGGFLLVENYKGGSSYKKKIAEAMPNGEWKPIPPDHELMRSFHLLASLPQCGELGWEGFHFDQRIGILMIPDGFLSALTKPQSTGCFASVNHEQALKIFINIMMVVLTTDYKNDQIHLPEILKRLR